MRLAALLHVLDEVELIDATLQHLDRLGFDLIVAWDLGSTDGTLATLEQWQKSRGDSCFQLVHGDAEEDEEASLALTLKIAEQGIDWLAYLDADEFLLTSGESLRKSLALTAEDCEMLSVQRFNVPVTENGLAMPLPPGDLDDIHLIHKPIPDFRSQLLSGKEAPWIRAIPLPKVIARPSSVGSVGKGNHRLFTPKGKPLRAVTPQDLLFAHVPFSTRARFRRKVDNIRKLIEPDDLESNIAWHWRRWVKLDEEGRIDEEYDRTVFSDAALAALRRDGVVQSATDVFRQWHAQGQGSAT